MTEEMKSNRGRPPRAVGTERFHISINKELALFWQMQLIDPLTGRIPVGLLSQTVERLLREEARKMGYSGQ